MSSDSQIRRKLSTVDRTSADDLYKMVLRSNRDQVLNTMTSKKGNKSIQLSSGIRALLMSVYSRPDIRHANFRKIETSILHLAERGIEIQPGVVFPTKKQRKVVQDRFANLFRALRQNPRLRNHTWNSLPPNTKSLLREMGVDSQMKWDRLDENVKSKIHRSARMEKEGNFEDVLQDLDPEVLSMFESDPLCAGMLASAFTVILFATFIYSAITMAEVTDVLQIWAQAGATTFGERLQALLVHYPLLNPVTLVTYMYENLPGINPSAMLTDLPGVPPNVKEKFRDMLFIKTIRMLMQQGNQPGTQEFATQRKMLAEKMSESAVGLTELNIASATSDVSVKGIDITPTNAADAAKFYGLSMEDMQALANNAHKVVRTEGIPVPEISDETVKRTNSEILQDMLISGLVGAKDGMKEKLNIVAEFLGFQAALEQTEENLGGAGPKGFFENSMEMLQNMAMGLVKTEVLYGTGLKILLNIAMGVIASIIARILWHIIKCAIRSSMRIIKGSTSMLLKASTSSLLTTFGIPIAALLAAPVTGPAAAATIGSASLAYGMVSIADPKFRIAKYGYEKMCFVGIKEAAAEMYEVVASKFKRKRTVKDNNTRYLQDFLNKNMEEFQTKALGERPTKRRFIENADQYRRQLKKYSATALSDNLINAIGKQGRVSQAKVYENLREIYMIQMTKSNFDKMTLPEKLRYLDRFEILLRARDKQAMERFERASEEYTLRNETVRDKIIELKKLMIKTDPTKMVSYTRTVRGSEEDKLQKHVERIQGICSKPRSEVLRIFAETKKHRDKDGLLPPLLIKEWYAQLGCLDKYSQIQIFLAMQLQRLEETAARTDGVFVVAEDEKFEPHSSWKKRQLVPICTGWEDRPVVDVEVWKKLVKSGWDRREYQGMQITVYQWLQGKGLLLHEMPTENGKIPLKKFCKLYAESIDYVSPKTRQRYCMSRAFQTTVKSFYGSRLVGTKCDIKGKGPRTTRVSSDERPSSSRGKSTLPPYSYSPDYDVPVTDAPTETRATKTRRSSRRMSRKEVADRQLHTWETSTRAAAMEAKFRMQPTKSRGSAKRKPPGSAKRKRTQPAVDTNPSNVEPPPSSQPAAKRTRFTQNSSRRQSTRIRAQSRPKTRSTNK